MRKEVFDYLNVEKSREQEQADTQCGNQDGIESDDEDVGDMF